LTPVSPGSQEFPIRYLVVVDGEHYPPVVEGALRDLVTEGHTVLAAVHVGGLEKLPASGVPDYGEFDIRSGTDPRSALDDAITELTPDAVLDLSDEPVLDYRRRLELVAVALHRGVPYEGADFRMQPPPRPQLCSKPSVAIIGTGKRSGKTAVGAFAARHLAATGHKPVVVAMGRGGPEEPEVLRGDEIGLEPRDLLEFADRGGHAASDYVEDALLARVATVGCRRCGGGLAGGVAFCNVPRGIELANDLPGDLIVLEGSGSAIPPAHADVTGLVVPASIREEYLLGYLGAYRLLLADFVVVTMCEYPFGSPSQASAIASYVRDAWRPSGPGREVSEGIPVVRTVFRPTPTRSVDGAAAYVATTAPEAAGESIRRHLEEAHGCRVVGASHALANRRRLEEELNALGTGIDVLLCEIKAAGVDVATRRALDKGMDVVYMDNVPHGIDGDDMGEVVDLAARVATTRFSGS
jgi:cyclic 2,3-diphosphoglycerate synthetase